MSFAAAMQRGQKWSKSVNPVMTSAPSNNFVLYGFVVSVYDARADTDGAAGGHSSAPNAAASAGGNSKPRKPSVTIELGPMVNDPEAIVREDGTRVREFEATISRNATDKADQWPDKNKKVAVAAHSELKFDMDEAILKGIPGGLQPGDAVKLQGIKFTYWYSANQGKVIVLTNVSTISRPHGLKKDEFAIYAWMGMHRPLVEAKDEYVEEEASSNIKRLLGKNTYELISFGDNKYGDGDAYTKRNEGILYIVDYVKKEHPEKQDDFLVDYLAKYYNFKTTSTVTEIGFKTSALGQQWAGGSLEECVENNNISRVFSAFRMMSNDVSMFRIAAKSAWQGLAPQILPHVPYVMTMKQNLEITHGQKFNEESNADEYASEEADFKMSAKPRFLLCDVATAYATMGLPVAPSQVHKILGVGSDVTALSSELHENNYHSRTAESPVIALNEWKGNLTALIEKGNYDFYIMTTQELSPDDREVLRKEDPEKIHLLFDESFRRDGRAAMRSAAKREELEKKHGLSGDSELIPISQQFTAGVTNYVFAVLKPELRKNMYLDDEKFRQAIAMLTVNPDEVLASMERWLDDTTLGGTRSSDMEVDAPSKKRSAEEEPPVEVRSPAKRQKRNKDEESQSESQAGRSRRGRRGKKGEGNDEPSSAAGDMVSQDDALDLFQTGKTDAKGNRSGRAKK